jgi:uncharacterized Zn-finger protein
MSTLSPINYKKQTSQEVESEFNSLLNLIENTSTDPESPDSGMTSSTNNQNRLEIMSDTEKFVDDVIQEVNSKSNSPRGMEFTHNINNTSNQLNTMESIDAVGDIKKELLDIEENLNKVQKNETKLNLPNFSNIADIEPPTYDQAMQQKYQQNQNQGGYVVERNTTYTVRPIMPISRVNSQTVSNIPPIPSYEYHGQQTNNSNHNIPTITVGQNQGPTQLKPVTIPHHGSLFYHQKSKSNDQLLDISSNTPMNRNFINQQYNIGSQQNLQSYPINNLKRNYHYQTAGPMRVCKSMKTSPVSTPYFHRSKKSSPIHTPGWSSPNNSMTQSLNNNNNNLPILPMNIGHIGNNNLPMINTITGNNTKPIINAKKTKTTQNIKKEYKEKPFRCPHPSKKNPNEQCSSSFSRPDELKRHVKIHDPNKPYKCKFCDMGFSRTDHLTTHTRTHTKEKPYACEKEGCDKRFARSDERLRHHQVHENRAKRAEAARLGHNIKKENKIIKQQAQQQQNMNNSFTVKGPTSTVFVPNNLMQTSLTSSGVNSMTNSMTSNMSNMTMNQSSGHMTYAPPTPMMAINNGSAYNSNCPSGHNSGYVTPNSGYVGHQQQERQAKEEFINYGNFH